MQGLDIAASRASSSSPRIAVGVDHPYRANRVVAVLSRMFSLALRWGMRRDGVNPAKGIEKNVEHHRRRYLKGDEMAGLLKALAAYPNEQLADAVRLLLLTGARRGEILRLALGRSRSRRRHLVKAAQQHETELGA